MRSFLTFFTISLTLCIGFKAQCQPTLQQTRYEVRNTGIASKVLDVKVPLKNVSISGSRVGNRRLDTLDKFVLVSSSHIGVVADYKKALQLTFNQDIDPATMRHIVILSGGSMAEPGGADHKTLSGTWKLVNHRAVIFDPSKPFIPGMFISITIPDTFKSLKGKFIEDGKDIISFIMDNGQRNGQQITKIDTLKMIGNHRISMTMSIPDVTKKHPVLLFLHGGGWSGGTPNFSEGSLPGGYYAKYLCDKLGVAVIGVGYRCKGSEGSFRKAKADIEDAVRYVKEHAVEFNLDINRLGISGESAGAPLAALVAQEDTDIKYYIGWNGIYDFVNDSDGKFGQGNTYGQEEPSAEANSALYHVRKNPPHTLLIHGTNDSAIHYRQSVAFGEAIKKAGGDAKTLLFEGQPHWYYYAPGGKYEISTLYQVKEFLIKSMALKVN